MLVVDDLQWADEPSQRFLAHLLGRADELPLLLLGAIRTGEDEGSALRELAAELDDDGAAAPEQVRALAPDLVLRRVVGQLARLPPGPSPARRRLGAEAT